MMAERKTYFISLDKQTISEVSVPDTVEYEIYVTDDELEKFKTLIRDNDHRDFWYAMKNIVFKPFAEKEVDEMRQQDDDNLIQAYQFIYQYGTEETRQKLTEVGFKPKS